MVKITGSWIAAEDEHDCDGFDELNWCSRNGGREGAIVGWNLIREDRGSELPMLNS